MAEKQVQLRRGTAGEHAAFTGAAGEMTIDTSDNRAVVHDGETAGGIPMAKEEEVAAKQPLSTLLSAIAALSTVANKFIYFTGLNTPVLADITAFARSLLDDADDAAAQNTLDVYSTGEVDAFLELGNATPNDHGEQTTGTLSTEPSDGKIQLAENGGAHTLAPPTETGAYLLYYTNNGSAGAITTSGFDVVLGDAFNTTDNNRFECAIVYDGIQSILQVTDLGELSTA